VGVVAVLAMHSMNVDKNMERMCARKVLAVIAMNVDHADVDVNVDVKSADKNVNNPEQVMLMNVNNVVLAVCAMNKSIENVNVNNPGQVLLSQEVLPVNVDHVDVDVNAEAMDLNNGNVNKLEQVLLVSMEKVKNKVLAVLAMFDVIREDDIMPRLNRTH
jgi:FlaG/FlaF family flagellin (archaellin)